MANNKADTEIIMNTKKIEISKQIDEVVTDLRELENTVARNSIHNAHRATDETNF
jgi:hypothetical protein